LSPCQVASSLEQAGLRYEELEEIRENNADMQAKKWGYKKPTYESTDRYEDSLPEGTGEVILPE
jgi:hypothetical protein